jgi:hypothetical protein
LLLLQVLQAAVQLPPVLVLHRGHVDRAEDLALAAVVAAQQVQELGRVHRVALDVLAAAVDLDGPGVHHHSGDAQLGQGPVQPEAIPPRLVAGADGGAGGQAEARLGLGDLLLQPGQVARRQAAVAWLLGRLGGTGQQPLVLAQFQSAVQRPRLGRGQGSFSVCKVQVSDPTETCTTSDTSLAT